MSTNATPVIGHGPNNLDEGLDLSAASQHDVFQSMANEMLGIEEEEVEQEVESEEDETEIEEELEEDESEEEEVSEEEDEDEESEEESDEEEADESEDETTDSEVFLVKVDGEEIEVTGDELVQGYQRQQDYTRKTQEVAEERKRLQEHYAELEAERTKYVTALDQLIQEESKELEKYNEVDWNKLKQEDPNQFLILQYELNEARTALQSKMEARKQAIEQSTSEKGLKEADYLAAQEKRAAEIVEGWRGPEHDKLVQGLQEQTQKLGFEDSDKDLLKHAIVIKLLQKAKEYDDYKASQTKVVEKKLKRKVPKVVKSGKSATGKTQDKSQKKYQESMARLRKTGNIKDSVDAFAAFL
ncbi:MJ0042 family finger-like protein [Vibrio phage vB_ValP_IME271]|nr:MJ0042 family finger-like protein [Vibrio phage vB_ValP_IME271]